MAQITYTDKTALNINGDIADTNKVNASDMNEIKNVVNNNYSEVGDITTLTTTDKTSVVNAINELNEKNIISVGLSANTNVSVSATWTHYSVNINNLVASLGTKLTLNTSTHRVIVGDGVSYVKVSCYTLIRGIASGIEFNVRKNGTAIGTINVQPSNTSIYETGAFTDILVPVSSGDYFDFTIRAGGTGTITIAGGVSTGITFEVIN